MVFQRLVFECSFALLLLLFSVVQMCACFYGSISVTPVFGFSTDRKYLQAVPKIFDEGWQFYLRLA